MYYKLDKDLNPVQTEGFRDMDFSKTRMALSCLGSIEVSSIFLILDHSWGNGPPVLWETMTLGTLPNGFRESGEQVRSTSLRGIMNEHFDSIKRHMLEMDIPKDQFGLVLSLSTNVMPREYMEKYVKTF